MGSVRPTPARERCIEPGILVENGENRTTHDYTFHVAEGGFFFFCFSGS